MELREGVRGEEEGCREENNGRERKKCGIREGRRGEGKGKGKMGEASWGCTGMEGKRKGGNE